MSRTEPPYTYTQLSGLFSALQGAVHSNSNKKALLNVWATVVEATAPRPTKGTGRPPQATSHASPCQGSNTEPFATPNPSQTCLVIQQY